jgi:hypothetical protein
MYRLLEDSGEPAKTADTRQEKPPQVAVNRPGGACRRARWKQPPATICWEASDQRKDETPLVEWRFVRLPGSAEGVIFKVTVVPAND